jgi:hypothetical protein
MVVRSPAWLVVIAPLLDLIQPDMITELDSRRK